MARDNRNFYIAKIEEEKKEEQNQEYEKKITTSRYVSSVSGYNVKDKIDYPYVSFGNKGYQYEGLKDKGERSDEYNKKISAFEEQRNKGSRIPSYLMREDITPEKRTISSYPTNERAFITKSETQVNNYEGIVEKGNLSKSSETKDNYVIKPNDEINTYKPDLISESKVNTAPSTEGPKSVLVRNMYSRADQKTVSFEDTKNFLKTREIKSDDQITEPVYEETFTVNKPIEKPIDKIEEPIYSTPDNFEDVDPFDDIQLELYTPEKEIEELDPYANKVQSNSVSNKGFIEQKPIKSTQPTIYDVQRSDRKQLKKKIKYIAPSLDLLVKSKVSVAADNNGTQYQRKVIDDTLNEFGIGGHVCNFDRGPAVTRFEIKLDPGVKVEKIRSISKNLQMNLESKSLRMQAPIPGKSTIGVEVPNQKQDFVLCGDLISHPDFLNDGNPLNVVLGKDVTGEPVYLDISSMPHGLIAGTPGSGKSVCINSIIMSILYKASPDQVKLILVDPKLIEFSNYEDIPHLATPVITDPKLAAEALKWAVDEMQRRYELFRTYKRRDYASFEELTREDKSVQPIPYVVIIIDELNDLMLAAAKSVEESITKLAQKSRAAGIHLLLATQRPSTDVISGTIKANILSRIAFAVTSQVDSRTILDHPGAETLLGKGDMLYTDGVNEQRVQGAFVSLAEIIHVADDIKSRYQPDFMFTSADLVKRVEAVENGSGEDITMDEFFKPVARWVVENESASINRIQKTFGLGFNRAQAIMEGLEQLNIVSENVGTKPRTVLVSMDELEDILDY